MKAYRQLPEGYREAYQIDLQKDKKTSLKVNIGAVVVMAAVLAVGFAAVPFTVIFESEPKGYFIRFGLTVVFYIAYIILHELTHAAAMKAVGGGKVVFGFTGLYAFAGSREDYFDKTAYRLIALAPVVIWGIVFGVLALLVPKDWFHVVWLLQAGNISGAAGDIYVTAKLWKAPEGILVRDTGVGMTVFDRIAG